MRLRLAASVLAAAGALLAVSSAAAEDKIVSTFVADEGGTYLTYIIEDCGECFVAQFACGDGAGFSLTLPDFDNQTLASALIKNGARGKLRLGSTELELTARQMTFSEMSGMWDIEFTAWGSDVSALEPLALSKPAIISTANGETNLPMREADSANARSFIDACLKAR